MFAPASWFDIFVTVEILLAVTIFITEPWKKLFPNVEPSLSDLPADGPYRVRAKRNSAGEVEEIRKPVINPFINQTWKMSTYEKAKISFMAVTLFPLKFLLFLVAVITCGVWCSIITRGQDFSRPIPQAVRKEVERAVRVSARMALFAMGFFQIRVKGERAGSSAAPVIVSNHICAVDPVVLFYLCVPSAVGEISNLRGPFIRDVVRAVQAITIDRRDPDSRKKVAQAIKSRAVSGGWPQTIIFPEATTTNGKAIISFKAGAFLPGVPVQPIVLKYPHQHFDPAWVLGGPPILFLIFRLFCQFINFVEVEFLPVYTPNEAEKKDANLFAQNVRENMAKVLGAQCTGHSFDDVLLSYEAKKAGLPYSAGVVEMNRVQSFFKVNKDTITKHLDKFARWDTNKDGKVSFSEFKAMFEADYHKATKEQEEQLQHMFSLLDTDDSGLLDFREYLVGMALVNDDKDVREEILRAGFDAIDNDGNGCLSPEELFGMLRRILPGLSEEDFRQFFDRADTDKNNAIEFHEFVAAIKSDPALFKIFREAFL